MAAGATSTPFSLSANASFKSKAADIFGALSAISVPRLTPSNSEDDTGGPSDALSVVGIPGLRVGVSDIDVADVDADVEMEDDLVLDCEVDGSCTTKEEEQSSLHFNDMSRMRCDGSLEAKVAAAASRLVKHSDRKVDLVSHANSSAAAKRTVSFEADKVGQESEAKSGDRNTAVQATGINEGTEKLCKNFSTYGDCHFGARCKFVHGMTEGDASKLKSKWTQHSLSDVHVSPEETQHTAMKFLEDLRRRKEAERLGVPVGELPKEGNASGVSIGEAVGDAKLVFKARDKPSGGMGKERSGDPSVKKKVKMSFDDDGEVLDMSDVQVRAPQKRKPRISFGEDDDI